MRTTGKALLSLAFLLVVAPAAAEENHCKLYPKGGLLKSSYDLIGPEACKAACSETEGCGAWSYQPHTFNPKKGPGHCRLMAEVGEEKPHKKDYCGRM